MLKTHNIIVYKHLNIFLKVINILLTLPTIIFSYVVVSSRWWTKGLMRSLLVASTPSRLSAKHCPFIIPVVGRTSLGEEKHSPKGLDAHDTATTVTLNLTYQFEGARHCATATQLAATNTTTTVSVRKTNSIRI